MRLFYWYAFVHLCCGFISVHAQDSTYAFNVKLQGALTNASTPFWLHSNTNGTVPKHGSFALGQFGLYKKYNVNNPRFVQWSAGAELIANTGKTNNLFFSDLYAAARFGPVELSAGQRREYMGLSDSTLTSGSVAMGSNFRPYPKIQLYTPKFVNVIPGNDILAIKLLYADGIMGRADVQYGNVTEVPQTYLHQKSMYARLGGERFLFNFYAGFNHQVMWGGEEIIFSGGLKKAEAYRYVVFGKPWLFSRVGNHFGTIDLAVELKTNNGNFLLYRQSIYEDGSLIKFSNAADGLNGIRFKRKAVDPADRSFKINTILFEFLYTKNQGGAVFNYEAGIFGNDNYFNHYIYKRGWSYKGESLGTPLISGQNILREDLQQSESVFTANNRIAAFHTGLHASWKDVNLIFKGTYSRNYGTYVVPFAKPLGQTSLLLSMEKSISFLKKSIIAVNIASDIGGLYDNNTALSVSWKKNGFIK
jgi:hypothetical protein